MRKRLNCQRFDLSHCFYHISQLFLYTIAVNILLASLFFAFGKGIAWYFLPLSICVSSILLVIFYDDTIDIRIVYEIIAGIIILLSLTHFVGRFYDLSWDGNSYHKLAVGLLKNQWNPLKALPVEISVKILGINPEENIWAESYCKGPWIFAASLYTMTGNIETGKVYNSLGMFCAFFITFYFLKKEGKDPYFCLLFSLSAALNPVAVSQLTSFYVDGFLHMMLYLLVLFLMINAAKKMNARSIASLIAASMIICGNIKFTGLLYGGIFCIVYYLWDAANIIFSKDPGWLKKCFHRLIPYSLLALITVFWAGNSSYLTNYIRHGTLTYPLTGDAPIDIITENSPFHEVNHFKNLFLSLFSQMDNMVLASEREPVLKIPFTIHWEQEKWSLASTDVRISGFGLLFSGIISVSMILLILALIRMKKDKKFFLILMNVLICFGMTIGITESWWARYAPHLYFLVLIALYLFFEMAAKRKRAIGTFLLAIVILNGVLFFKPLPETWNYSAQIYSNICSLKDHEPVSVHSTFPGIYFNLEDMGITYQIDEELQEDASARDLGYRSVKYRAGN